MYTLRLDGLADLAFNTREGVFHPTGTTASLFRAFCALGERANRLLDLGCGCGVVGIAAGKIGLAGSPVYASDVSEQAVECARLNATRLGCELIARTGSLFEPWAGEKFDTILDDVSGVAEEIAQVSPWFVDVPCKSGVDGSELVCDVIRRAPDYLMPGGRLIFPVISLSNGRKILDCAAETFDTVRSIAHETWPLPAEMRQHSTLLMRMHEEGRIQITRKFGMIIFHTDIYVASNKTAMDQR